jgi:hypothetical protein
MVRQIVRGLVTYIPGVNNYLTRKTGGTNSARYCYSVWLRHLIMAHSNELNTNPKIVAELGPGDSIGIGLASLLTGADKYFAFDVIEHASVELNLKIFDELLELFEKRTPIPGAEEFPRLKPYLKAYDFPHHILNKTRISHNLNKKRVNAIRKSILSNNNSESLIQYKVPWDGIDVIKGKSVDMIFSQAVLEHVTNINHAYQSMHYWLNDDGYLSHQIDFKSHGTSNEWNGHWRYSNLLFKLIQGRRIHLINRLPLSAHLSVLKKIGFFIKCNLKVKTKSNIDRKDLSPVFQTMTDDDLITSGAFIQAVKIKP